MFVFWVVAPCTDVSEVLASSIIISQMFKVASTSVTSVSFYQTRRRNNPEDSHIHARCRENLQANRFVVSRET
jgi:hypothetical protein